MTIHLPKVNQFGGGNGGGGGSSSLPVIVTSSGSSLPSASGFEWKDTFLNTSDKKIYTAIADTYELNTNANLYSYVYGTSGSVDTPTIDYTTGIMTGADLYKSQYANYYYSKFVRRSSLQNLRWQGSKEYRLHFKLNSAPNDNKQHNIIYLKNVTGYNGYDILTVIHICIKNKNLYIGSFSSGYYNVSEKVAPVLLNDFDLEANVEYYVTVSKQDNKIVTTITLNSYDGQVLKSQTIDNPVEDVNSWSNDSSICYGGDNLNSSYLSTNFSISGEGFSIGQIYLLDSTGDFLKASSELSWDSGVAIEDKTEYADKTNGILYLYEDTELIQIPQNKNLVFTNVSASSWVSDSTYTDYEYKCELSCSGVTANDFAQVIFAPTEADSGNYATVCQTGSGTVTIYSKVNDTITIPSIVVMGV